VVVSFGFLPLAMFLSIFRNALTNMTTYERSNRHYYPHFRGGNPFDRGFGLNLKEFFGTFMDETDAITLNHRRFRQRQLAENPDIYKTKFGYILPYEMSGVAATCRRGCERAAVFGGV
jgi:hypothetical protein